MSQADINVWWDLESIKFENSFDPLWSYDAIKSSLERLGLVGKIASVKAFAVDGVFSKKIITRLTKRPVEFVPVSVPADLKSRNGSQLVDSLLSLDLARWTKKHKPPNVIVLMSCDEGYLGNLEGLKAAGYETCIIYATGSCTSKNVESTNMFKLKWVQEVLKTANPVDPKIYNLPYYGIDVNFKVIRFEEKFLPTSISVGCKHIWMVSGASNRPSLNHPGLARVIMGEISCSGSEYKRLQICKALLQKLQGEDDGVEDSIIMMAAEDAMNASMALLKKKNEKIKDSLLAPSIPSS